MDFKKLSKIADAENQDFRKSRSSFKKEIQGVINELVSSVTDKKVYYLLQLMPPSYGVAIQLPKTLSYLGDTPEGGNGFIPVLTGKEVAEYLKEKGYRVENESFGYHRADKDAPEVYVVYKD